MVISVEPHSVFVRNEFDLHMELPINIAQASLGATVQIPTLEGTPEKLEIPAGTQTGKSFRKRGLGIPRLQRTGRGDLIVTARIVTPTNLNSEQKELLRRLAESFGDETIEHKKGFFDRILGTD